MPVANHGEENAIEILKNDHRRVESLFEEFENAQDEADRVGLAQQIVTALTLHASIEESLFYPRVRQTLDEGDTHLVDEATVEHGSLKQLMADLGTIAPRSPMFEANMKVLKEYVTHHVREEEEELMPKAEDSGIDLVMLGNEISQRREEMQGMLEKKQARRSAAPAKRVRVPSLEGTGTRRTATPRRAAQKAAPARRGKAAATAARGRHLTTAQRGPGSARGKQRSGGSSATGSGKRRS